MIWIGVLMALSGAAELTPFLFEPGLEDWTRYPDDTIARAVGEDGSAACIEVPEEQSIDYRQLFRFIDVKPGSQVRLHVETRGEDLGEAAAITVSLGFYNEDKERIGNRDHHVITDSEEWFPLVCRGVAPEGTVRANVIILLHGHGKAHFRNVSMEVTPPRERPVEEPLRLSAGEETGVPYFGLGAEDDGWFYNEENAKRGVDEAAIALREKRLRWMDLDYVRMFFWYRDFCPTVDGKTFTWDTDNMRSHYRTLELYQSMGAMVNICGVEWAVDDPWGDPEACAETMGELLEHLIRVKGFTCIKQWTLTNEPNLFYARQGGTFERFVRIHQLVKQQIEERGLDVTIVGSDDGDGTAWFRECVTNPEYFAACDSFATHIYIPEITVPLVREFFDERVAMLDAQTPRKPFIIGEYGLQDERFLPPATNPYMREFPYAMWIHYVNIHALASGVSAMSIWCVHEMYYPGGAEPMAFGLWDFGPEWKTRPVYHSMAAFTRHSDAGDTVRRYTSSDPSRVVAVQVGKTLYWVNISDKALRVALPESWKQVRVYEEGNTQGDEEAGVLVPVEDGEFTAPSTSFGYITQ